MLMSSSVFQKQSNELAPKAEGTLFHPQIRAGQQNLTPLQNTLDSVVQHKS